MRTAKEKLKIRGAKVIVCLSGIVLFSSCGGPLQYTKNGNLHYSRGEYERAAAEYRKNIKYYESINYPLYMLNLAVADYRAGLTDEAERAFLTALKLSHGENLSALEKNFGFLAPKSEESYRLRDYEEVMAHFYLALIYIRTNKLEKAIVEFKKINLIDPEHPLMHYIMGKSYQLAGKDEEAEIEFRLTNRYRKDFPYSYLDRVEFYGRSGMSGEAAGALKKYLAADEGSSLSKKLSENAFDLSGSGELIVLLEPESYVEKIKKENRSSYFFKIYIDGEYHGKSHIIEDIDLQKTKKRISKMLKSALKDAARSMIIEKAFGVKASDNVERREWEKIPGLIHLFKTHLPEGSYNLKAVLYFKEIEISEAEGDAEIKESGVRFVSF